MKRVWHRCKSAVPRADCPQKPSDHVRKRLLREATKRPMPTVEELRSLLADTSHITTVLCQSQNYGKVANRKPLLEKCYMTYWLQFARKPLGDSQESSVAFHQESSMI